MFDAFFTTRETVGTGIALFVAKQPAEGHGGQISIASSRRAAERWFAFSCLLVLSTRLRGPDDLQIRPCSGEQTSKPVQLKTRPYYLDPPASSTKEQKQDNDQKHDAETATSTMLRPPPP